MTLEVLQYSIILVSILGILAVIIVLVLFTPIAERDFRKYIMNNIIFASLLCAVTFALDLYFLSPGMLGHLRGVTSLRGTIYTLACCVWVLAASAGLFAALRSVPAIGSVLQWMAWMILTVPFRMFYYVAKSYPTAQHLLDLFSVKPETAAGTIFTFITPEAVIKAFIPDIIIFAAFMYFSRRQHEDRKPKLLWRVFVFSVGMLCFVMYIIYPRGNYAPADSIGRSVNIFREFGENMKGYFMVRDEFFSEKLQAQPQDNILFIIDESVRGDYLSINNSQLRTTQLLEKYLHDYPDNVFNYGVALSAANGSFVSRSALLTGLNHVPDSDLHTFKAPTIFDIAHANGYKTILMHIPGNMPDLVFRQTDLDRIDEVYLTDRLYNSYGLAPDFNGASFIKQRLSQEKGLFILVIRVGLHVPYEDHYPSDNPEYILYTPKMEKGEWYALDKRQKIINSYKNCMSYNVDSFFSYLTGDNPAAFKNCTIIYTSDHGQSFMEYGQFESHNTRYLEQALVPFLIFSTEPWVLEHLKRPDEIHCTISHFNIAPTLQSIFCRDLDYSSGSYDSLVTSRDFRKPPLIHLNGGTIWTGTPSSPVPTDDNGKMILPTEKYMY